MSCRFSEMSSRSIHAVFYSSSPCRHLTFEGLRYRGNVKFLLFLLCLSLLLWSSTATGSKGKQQLLSLVPGSPAVFFLCPPPPPRLKLQLPAACRYAVMSLSEGLPSPQAADAELVFLCEQTQHNTSPSMPCWCSHFHRRRREVSDVVTWTEDDDNKGTITDELLLSLDPG